MKKTALFFLILLFLPLSSSAEKTRRQAVGFYLDTVIILDAYLEEGQETLLTDALLECGRYEALLSRTREGSDVWNVNHAQGTPVSVSEDTLKILQTAQEVSRLSDGAFDVTVARASVLWDFSGEEKIVPDASALWEAAQAIDYTKIRIEENTVTLPENMMLDLGGIAKGYIADRIKEFLMERGVQSAVLSFGGNVVCIGTKPDGSPWRVGIRDIDKSASDPILVTLNDGFSTVTSGIYERNFEADGKLYHHILDPKTGWPVENTLASVTVFSENSIWGDALSTAFLALGETEGMALAEQLKGVEAVFITRDRRVLYSSGAQNLILE